MAAAAPRTSDDAARFAEVPTAIGVMVSRAGDASAEGDAPHDRRPVVALPAAGAAARRRRCRRHRDRRQRSGSPRRRLDRCRRAPRAPARVDAFDGPCRRPSGRACSCGRSCAASDRTSCTPTTRSPGSTAASSGRLARVPAVVNTTHGLYATPEDRWPKRWTVYALEAVASRFSHAELCQNPEDFELMVRRRIVARRKARLLGNGVDLERFDSGRGRGRWSARRAGSSRPARRRRRRRHRCAAWSPRRACPS